MTDETVGDIIARFSVPGEVDTDGDVILPGAFEPYDLVGTPVRHNGEVIGRVIDVSSEGMVTMKLDGPLSERVKGDMD